MCSSASLSDKVPVRPSPAPITFKVILPVLRLSGQMARASARQKTRRRVLRATPQDVESTKRQWTQDDVRDSFRSASKPIHPKANVRTWRLTADSVGLTLWITLGDHRGIMGQITKLRPAAQAV